MGRLGKTWVVWILLAVMAGLGAEPGKFPEAQAAEEYPGGPLTYTIFWPPGGRSDLVARIVGPYLEKHLGAPVVIHNNVGGAGVIGHKTVREAKPDGTLVAQSGTTVIFQYTKPGISLSDYTWIANIYSAPFVVAVPSESKFKTLKELVDFAKANPGKLRHGNSGTGSTTHLGSAGFGMKTGVALTQIAYKGEGPAVVGLASGEVDLSFGPMIAFKQMIEAGKLRVLAVCAPKRLKQYPQIPTCKELGYDFHWEAWEAIFGPKGLAENQAVWPKLSGAIQKALHDPELVQKLSAMGLDAEYRAGQELEKWLQEEDRETKKVIFELGLQYKP